MLDFCIKGLFQYPRFYWPYGSPPTIRTRFGNGISLNFHYLKIIIFPLFSYFLLSLLSARSFLSVTIVPPPNHGVISTTSSIPHCSSLQILSMILRLTGSFFPSFASVALLIPILSLSSVRFICLSISVFHSLS